MAARRKAPKKSRLSPVARETRASERSDVVTEDDVKAAFDIINRDYWQDVHYLGDILKDEIEKGEITDEDTLSQRLNQAVDDSGSGRI